MLINLISTHLPLHTMGFPILFAALVFICEDARDDGVKRFHEMKRRWGFPQLLALGTFKDPSNGYLVDDSCVFGAEILVIKHTGKWESLSMIKSPCIISTSTFTWEIENFSNIEEFSLSKTFTVGQREWYVL